MRDEVSAAARAEVAAAEWRLPPRYILILQLGSTNDAAGTPDACGHERARRVAELYSAAAGCGRAVRVLTSGGVEQLDEGAAPRFNPTRTPHWQLIRATLIPAPA